MFRWLVVLSLPLILAACRLFASPEPVPSGELSAVLSGAIHDTYKAEGSEPPHIGHSATFASARSGEHPGMFGIMGLRARGATQDALLLELRGAMETGVYPARGFFRYGDPEMGLDSGRIFDLSEGQIEVISITSERIRGTFEGTAVEVSNIFSAPRPPDTLRISEGRFDVPLVPFSR